MVSTDKGNLGSRVFFIWGSLCTVCFFYAYFLISETKGLTLEQVDKSKLLISFSRVFYRYTDMYQ